MVLFIYRQEEFFIEERGTVVQPGKEGEKREKEVIKGE